MGWCGRLDQALTISVIACCLLSLPIAAADGRRSSMLERGQKRYTSRFREADLTSGRIVLWEAALSHVLSHPLPDPDRWYRRHRGRQAHETHLTHGIEAGIIGMLSSISLTLAALIAAWKECIRTDLTTRRMWSGVALVMLIGVVMSACSISTPGHKLLWAMLFVCSYQFGRQGPRVAAVNAGGEGVHRMAAQSTRLEEAPCFFGTVGLSSQGGVKQHLSWHERERCELRLSMSQDPHTVGHAGVWRNLPAG